MPDDKTGNMPDISPELMKYLRGRHLCCGFSGGSDSLFLLLLLKQAASSGAFSLKAVHFEHGLRGVDSLADEQWCRAFCEKQNIPILVRSLDVPKNALRGESVESAARRLRLAVWRELTAADPSVIVALGHNADDRAENLFLRLFRGSNVSGLIALRPYTELNGLRIVRPILSFSKKEVESKLRSAGFDEWRTDATNEESVCSRNILRLMVLPEIRNFFPFAEKGILHSLENLEQDAVLLEEQAETAWNVMLRKDGFSPREWLKLPSPIRCRVLRKFLGFFLKTDYIPDSALITRFDCAMNQLPRGGESIILPLKDRPEILRIGRTLVAIENPEAPEVPDFSVCPENGMIVCFDGKEYRFEIRPSACDPVSNDRLRVCFDADSLEGKLIFSRWHHGDRMTPFGRKTSVPVKKLLTEMKLRAGEREKTHVLRNESGLPVWIPGVRASSFAPVVEGTTKRVLVIYAGSAAE